ncbi:HesA/MoeB/ThiF family protein [Pseudotabrizicola alkalilacus]|uniref:HesA/MoeB/ThiF family protein n=1 Tax=Pseudotabrizicola alkalilacus TaxID=2305252 RepID=A0A411Z2K4_9RHOB|nr:HesA/MoeB/ThiF family protein [Pseudotabrizicola alkalilacus]RGP37289.1 HesA/MoeB/ThiF family protein [Pseudotabrizicola alkalilacus]
MTRYARQTVLPQVGATGQARLARAHVLVVGAGGLGVPVLQYLTGAGVGQITLVDGDVVEEHNLPRQPLYRMDQIGQPKARAAAMALGALNPQVQVTPLVGTLDPANAPGLVAMVDVVLDCADTFAASLTLSDACRDSGTPLITASALAMSGYVAGCCGPAPSLRAIFPDLPERGATCATAGVMGPVVGAVGALQAQMALAVLLGLEPSPLGRLVSLDALGWRMGGFGFADAPEPDRPLAFIGRSQIRADDLLIDLRAEAAPFSPQARHIPPEAMPGLTPPEGRRVVLACATGLRAHNAGQQLQTRWPGEIALLAVHD